MNVKRFFDVIVSLILIVLLSPVLLLATVLVKMTSPGPVIYWSKRIGQDEILFFMPKFRTMHLGTEEVATHLLKNPSKKLTKFGGLLRKTSVDEMPQLWSVLIGHMSLVGPRPALHTQRDLVEMRRPFKIAQERPGITGLSQVIGRDSNSMEKKVKLEAEYKIKKSMYFDIYIIFKTLQRLFFIKDISH